MPSWSGTYTSPSQTGFTLAIGKLFKILQNNCTFHFSTVNFDRPKVVFGQSENFTFGSILLFTANREYRPQAGSAQIIASDDDSDSLHAHKFTGIQVHVNQAVSPNRGRKRRKLTAARRQVPPKLERHRRHPWRRPRCRACLESG